MSWNLVYYRICISFATRKPEDDTTVGVTTQASMDKDTHGVLL